MDNQNKTISDKIDEREMELQDVYDTLQKAEECRDNNAPGSDYYKIACELIPEYEKRIDDIKADILRLKRLSEGVGITLRSLDSFEEKRAEFLIPQRVPKGQITILGGEGGSGKSLVVADMVAAISSGRKCLLSEDVPFEVTEENRVVLLFNAEDDLERVMKGRLKAAGAVESNVFSLSLADNAFSEVRFDNPRLEKVIRYYMPSLVVFDPLQSFLDPSVNMAARNSMRSALAPLIGWGEKYGTSFVIVMHTNKMAGAFGRKRLADSSDMWDISRSVLMVGRASDGTRYISHEKNNYGMRAKTILFDIDEEGRVRMTGTTEKTDADFVTEAYKEARNAPARESAEEIILSYLTEHRDEKIEVGTFDKDMMNAGIAKSTLRRAKETLKESGKIKLTLTGGGSARKWFISSTHYEKDK